MSAKIPANMRIKDLLKATGYDCPEELQNKTFNEATSGSGSEANIATCTLTVGTGYYQTTIDKEDFDDGSNDSLYGGWKLNSVSGSSGFFDYKENAEITTNDSRISAIFDGNSLSIKYEPSVSIEEGTIVIVTIKWTEASANLKAEEIDATDIRTSVERGQAITPPEGYDGFSEITFPSYLLTEEKIVVNGTKEFGTGSAPYFPKKVTVNIPSNYTIEEKSFSKTSEPFTLDCSDKTFVYMMAVVTNGVGQGITGLVTDLLGNFTVNVSSAGSTAGTMTWTASTKTLTYTPNTNFQMGSTRFKLVTI